MNCHREKHTLISKKNNTTETDINKNNERQRKMVFWGKPVSVVSITFVKLKLCV